MKKTISMILAALLLTSCASGPSNYALYADTQNKIAQASAIAEAARYTALAEIAKSGDPATRVAAVLSIQMGQGSNTRAQPQIAAPEDWDTKLLRWAGVLVPAAVQGLAIGAQMHAVNTQRQVAVTQSNNALATAQSTNNTFAAMSQNAANSNTNIATAGFNAATTLGTAGITGVNTTASAGIAGINTAVANGNTLTNNVATGYTSALQAAINKLTGTTPTTTTSTTNTTSTTTSTNNNICPAGQVLTGGQCQ